VQWSAITAPM